MIVVSGISEVARSYSPRESRHSEEPARKEHYKFRNGELTGSQILPDMQRAQYAVRYVEIREHFQLDDLIGHVQEGLGIHREHVGVPLFVRRTTNSPTCTSLQLPIQTFADKRPRATLAMRCLLRSAARPVVC